MDNVLALNNELDRLAKTINNLSDNRENHYDEDKLYKNAHEQLSNIINSRETETETETEPF